MNFQVEVVAGCNLTCAECPVRMIQRPGDSRYIFLKPEIWETILHKYIVPYKHLNAHLNPPTFIPNKDGEPLLNKRLPNMLRDLASVAPDMHVSIYTHGLLLPRLPFLDALGALPNRVRLMTTFHFYNHDGSENDYTETTAYLRSRVHDWPRNVELILISHRFPPMTDERLAAWKASWDGFPATVHANVQINPWTGLIKGEGLTKFDCCPYEKFDHMFFGATGNVIACCMDLEEEIVFGNVMKDDPAEMVGTVEAFYAAQKRREVKYAVCHDCFGLPPAPRPLLKVGVHL